MTKLPHAAALGLFVLAGLGAARAAEPMGMDHATMAPAAAVPPAGGPTAADKAFAAANDAMMKGMEVRPTGDPDRDFAAMMLPHHRGAVEMAEVEMRYGKDPMLRKLAADIIRAQKVEIAQMQAWQKRHGR